MRVSGPRISLRFLYGPRAVVLGLLVSILNEGFGPGAVKGSGIVIAFRRRRAPIKRALTHQDAHSWGFAALSHKADPLARTPRALSPIVGRVDSGGSPSRADRAIALAPPCGRSRSRSSA